MSGGGKLRGWKEIARHLRADERTVRRWEGRGLPVHRVPGEGRSSVFADPAELDQWLGQGGAGEPAPAMGAATPAPHVLRRWPLIAVAAIAVAALIGVAGWRGRSHLASPATRHPTDAGTAALVDQARLQNGRLTPEGFRQAIALSQAALARDPQDAAAYGELAFANIRLPDVDATVDRRLAYERAQQAAQRALDIDPNSWRAHSTMGFIEYGYHWNFVAGVRHFREVIRINPSRGPGHNQLGLALLDMGDTKDGLAELELSSRLEPSNPMYRAIYAQAQYVAGDRAASVATWRQIVADNPNLIEVRQMLLDDALVGGDWPGAAAQVTEMARQRHLAPDGPVIEPVLRALAGGDRATIFKALLKAAQARQAAGPGGDFEVARIDALFGDNNGALAALKTALEAREPDAIGLRADPLLAGLRADPRFERLARTYGLTTEALRG